MDKFDKFTKIDESNIDIILEDIKEFLQLYLFKGNVSLNDDVVEELFELSHEDLITLKTVHFLLSDEIRKLIKILPQLIRNLAHSTQKETENIKGNIHGKINWKLTIKERYSQGFNDKSLFTCNPPSKYYDLEENQLLKYLDSKDLNIALDIKGKKFNSPLLAELIDKAFNSFPRINFIIGSSNGLSSKVKNLCQEQISFGDITMPHGLFRVVLLEQIYRAFKINNNESYHK